MRGIGELVRRYSRGVVSNKECDVSLPGAGVVVSFVACIHEFAPGFTNIDAVFHFGARFGFAKSDTAPAGQDVIVVIPTLVRNRDNVKIARL